MTGGGDLVTAAPGSRAQQFGILCLTVCVIQLLGLISFDVT